MRRHSCRSLGLRFLGMILAVQLLSCTARRDAADGALFPAQPTCEARAGFHWEEVSGAGLRFWSQRNGELRVVPDTDLPGARLERDGVTERVVMRVLRFDGEGPEALLARLEQLPGWEHGRRCVLREVAAGRRGVRRFELRAAEEEGAGAGSVAAVCGGRGAGVNRYFELQRQAPGRALWVDAGEEPLFDAQSVVLLPDSVAAEGAVRLRGRLVLAPEVRAFTPCGDTCAYWVVDRTGVLAAEYDLVTGGEKCGAEVEAELEVVDAGPSDEGFAAQYAGVYEVTRVVRMKPAAGR